MKSKLLGYILTLIWCGICNCLNAQNFTDGELKIAIYNAETFREWIADRRDLNWFFLRLEDGQTAARTSVSFRCFPDGQVYEAGYYRSFKDLPPCPAGLHEGVILLTCRNPDSPSRVVEVQTLISGSPNPSSKNVANATSIIFADVPRQVVIAGGRPTKCRSGQPQAVIDEVFLGKSPTESLMSRRNAFNPSPFGGDRRMGYLPMKIDPLENPRDVVTLPRHSLESLNKIYSPPAPVTWRQTGRNMGSTAVRGPGGFMLAEYGINTVGPYVADGFESVYVGLGGNAEDLTSESIRSSPLQNMNPLYHASNQLKGVDDRFDNWVRDWFIDPKWKRRQTRPEPRPEFRLGPPIIVSERSALNELYQRYLGRDVDPVGLAHWLGRSSGEIHDGILNSVEFKRLSQLPDGIKILDFQPGTIIGPPAPLFSRPSVPSYSNPGSFKIPSGLKDEPNLNW